MTDPKLTRITVEYSKGAWASLKEGYGEKFDVKLGQTYEVPEGTYEEDVRAYADDKFGYLKDLVDDYAQAEVNDWQTRVDEEE